MEMDRALPEVLKFLMMEMPGPAPRWLTPAVSPVMTDVVL